MNSSHEGQKRVTQKKDGRKNPANTEPVEPPKDYSWRESIPYVLASLFLMAAVAVGIVIGLLLSQTTD